MVKRQIAWFFSWLLSEPKYRDAIMAYVPNKGVEFYPLTCEHVLQVLYHIVVGYSRHLWYWATDGVHTIWPLPASIVLRR